MTEPGKLTNPAMIVSLASIATVGVTTAMTMRKLSQVEQCNDELKAHVANLGSIVEKYPNAESAARIIDELRNLNHAVIAIQTQNELLARENKSLRNAIEVIAKNLDKTTPGISRAVAQSEIHERHEHDTLLRRPINQVVSRAES